jgi:hypothetical protein
MASRFTKPEYDFQKISKNLPFEKNSKDAREWFRDTAMSIRKMSVPEFQRSAKPFQNVQNLNLTGEAFDRNSIGKMYMFVYDPKHKLTLPYYDTFPLVFPICPKSGSGGTPGMLGLNMHYLPPGLRARFMDNLYTLINNDKYDSTTKLNLVYGTLKAYSQYRYFKPCIHHYLFPFVRSPFINISPKAWDYTLMLPLARFQKKSQDYVWLESSLKVS